MTVSLLQVLMLVVVVVLGYMAARWLFQKDTEIEDRRRGAAKLAAVLQAYGLKKLPELLIDYSVGDYSGIGQKAKQMVELLLSGETAVIAEFDTVYERVLAEKLKTDSGRALIAAKLADAAVKTDPSAVLEAPVPAVVPAK